VTNARSPRRRRAAAPAALVARGHEALARGEWRAARAAFEQVLRRTETAEALEGLGTAAWWLDDARVTFDARERAYRLYRRRGDRRGAARLATHLAEGYFHFRGEAAVAGGWHRRARRLLEGLAPTPEHGWLRLWEGDLALKLSDPADRARALAIEAAAIGQALGDVDLEMTALALEGLSLVIEGRPAEGMPRLDEATTAAVSGEMTDRLAIGLSCCYLLTACERVRDFDRAAQWCERVKAFSRRTRFNFLLAICRAEYGAVLTWRGAWAEAELELKAAVRQLGATRPAMQSEGLVRLARLRHQQGRFDEAAALLKPVAEHPLSVLTRAELALDRAEPAVALRLAERFLRQVPASNRTDRIAALDVLVGAHLALGHSPEARAGLAALQEIAAAVPTDAMRATALVAAGRVAAGEGDDERARGAFEDAIALLSRSGGSVELARCRVELGRALARAGQRPAAEAEVQAALASFQRLGAARDAQLADALRREMTGAATARLTRREIDVLRLITQGFSNRTIAVRLALSEFTVKRHVANLLTKLDLPTRAAAAAYAGRQGLG
jgi:DNA-binding CsgD family transcriptional regulator